MEKTCEKCHKIFATKYTLKKHIDSKICEEISKNEPILLLCSSTRCGYQSLSKSDLQKHLKTCKYIEMDVIISHIHKEHQKEIESLKMEHQKEMMRCKEEWMDKEQERMASLLEKVMTKPVINNTNNTNTTTTNIRGNNNNLQSLLAPPELYEKQVDPNRIKALDQSDVEKHFWLGQKGIARLCVDHVIKTVDEDGNSKMLICCTDSSRKRFKYIDENNHIADDMEARNFIDTVSAPIVTVCKKVYDTIVSKIEDDKKETTDAFDLNLLENKTNIAQQKFLEIKDISDHNRNSDYKNEMSILLKK